MRRMTNQRWAVTYNHGLMNDSVVYADDESMAIKEALALYRKNAGFVETVDNLTAKFVVKSVTPIAE